MRRVLIAVVLVVAVGVVGVRLADPSLDAREDTVSFDAPPEKIAAESVRAAHTKSVTVYARVVVSEANGTNRTRRGRIRADHDDQLYRTRYSTGGDGELAFFGTDGMGWTKSPYGGWGRAPSARHPGFGTVLDPDAMDRSDARVLVDNATTLGVRFEGEDANAAVEGLNAHTEAVLPGRLDVYIDKRQGLPIRAVRVYSNPERNVTVRVRYRFARYGETTVERPMEIPKISLWELLGDLYYD